MNEIEIEYGSEECEQKHVETSFRYARLISRIVQVPHSLNGELTIYSVLLPMPSSRNIQFITS